MPRETCPPVRYRGGVTDSWGDGVCGSGCGGGDSGACDASGTCMLSDTGGCRNTDAGDGGVTGGVILTGNFFGSKASGGVGASVSRSFLVVPLLPSAAAGGENVDFFSDVGLLLSYDTATEEQTAGRARQGHTTRDERI